jgi:hypothetical protein
MRVTVVIPTRGHPTPDGRPYHERARASVEAQQLVAGAEITAVVARDRSPVPLGPARVVNAAVARAAGDVVALLEDDDEWVPGKLAAQLPLLDRFDFVTATQREVDERGAFVRDAYFPTPSTWLLSRSAWELLGGYDEALRFHYDNDLLGRASAAGLRRAHVVPAGADPDAEAWRQNIARAGAAVVVEGLAPLVVRTVRPGTLTSRRERDAGARATSSAELAEIARRYGWVPW